MKIKFYADFESQSIVEKINSLKYFECNFTVDWGGMPLPLKGHTIGLSEYLFASYGKYGEYTELEWLLIYDDLWFEIQSVEWQFDEKEKCFMPRFNLMEQK